MMVLATLQWSFIIYTVPTFSDQGSPFDGIVAALSSSELQDRTMFDKEINLEWIRKKVMCTFTPCQSRRLRFPSSISHSKICPNPPQSNMDMESYGENRCRVLCIASPRSGCVPRSE